jgi:hypothetical protein
MSLAMKYLDGSLALIAVYLVAKNFNAFNTLLGTSVNAVNANFKVLQGR